VSSQSVDHAVDVAATTVNLTTKMTDVVRISALIATRNLSFLTNGCDAAALGCKAAALGCNAAALGCKAAALGCNAATLGCEAATLGCKAATLGCKAANMFGQTDS